MFGSRRRPYPYGAHALPTELKRQNDYTFSEFVTDVTTGALWPRNARNVVAVVAVIAHLPYISSSHNIAHLPRSLADDLSLAAPPLLHTPIAEGTYFDVRWPCYVYRARYSCKTQVQQVRAGALHKDAAHGVHYLRPSVLAPDHLTLLFSIALDAAQHYRSPFARTLGTQSYFAIQGLGACLRSRHGLLLVVSGALGTPEARFCAASVGPKRRPAFRPSTLRGSHVGEGG